MGWYLVYKPLIGLKYLFDSSADELLVGDFSNLIVGYEVFVFSAQNLVQAFVFEGI